MVSDKVKKLNTHTMERIRQYTRVIYLIKKKKNKYERTAFYLAVRVCQIPVQLLRIYVSRHLSSAVLADSVIFIVILFRRKIVHVKKNKKNNYEYCYECSCEYLENKLRQHTTIDRVPNERKIVCFYSQCAKTRF